MKVIALVVVCYTLKKKLNCGQGAIKMTTGGTTSVLDLKKGPPKRTLLSAHLQVNQVALS